MFSQRTSAQKPGKNLLADFRQQFPQIAVSSEATAPSLSQTAGPEHQQQIGIHHQEGVQHVNNEVMHDQDPTPRASNEPWRFTPSLLDPSTFSFNAFAHGPPGFYTPTPGGGGTLYHSQAGDLHTPTLALHHGLGTPLSMPTSDGTMHHPHTGMDMSGFQAMHPQHFTQFNPYLQPPPQQAFAPSSFVHQDTGYETMDHDGSPMDSDPSDERMPSIAAALQGQQTASISVNHSLPASAEKFRFHTALNAPTAMIKHADEIPITYLNKGQAYSLSVADTNGSVPIVPGTKYRTFVRVSFEDEQQRQKPGVCWTLWKEGRGTNEAHQRGGKLQAVEYVEAGQPAEGDDKRTRVEVESSSFDGFSVVWTPGANGAPEVNIAVRFNFLSTDFSHSKGVKGIPVRLCAKTSLVQPENSPPSDDVSPEICFSKVKLFRDHGAERKLSNDVAHVKKSIDKLKQQISQAESGMKDFGKRKRASGISKAVDPKGPGKVQKHKRTWSMSSASSAGGGPRLTIEEDLHYKLQTLQDMFTSTRPVSVLYLRGEELDDPDLHPVALQGDASPSLREGINWQARSGHTSDATSFVSPSPSSLSLASQASGLGSSAQWQNFDSTAPSDVLRKRATRIKTDDDGSLSGWIEALGVDPAYRPPPERAQKPVACFYIKNQVKTEAEQPGYHRAVYLSKRTVQDLNERIAEKWGLNVSHIRRTIHVINGSLEVEIDDDVVQELKEAQPMILEIEQVVEQSPVANQQWEMNVDGTGAEAEASTSSITTGLVLRLTF